MNNTKKIRVLITYIESGMGHIVSARAISDALRSKYNDSFEVIEKHVLRDSDSDILKKYERFLVSEVKKHSLLPGYCALQMASMHLFGSKNTLRFVHNCVYKKQTLALLDEYKKYNPDIIVCTHYFCLFAANEYRNKISPNTLVVNYCPDNNVHGWWDNRADRLYTNNPKATADAYKQKFTKDQVLEAFYPVRDSVLNVTESKTYYREKFGLPQDSFTIVVANGLYAFNKTKRICNEIMKSDKPITLCILASSSKKIKNYFDSITLNVKPNITLKTFGYLENAPELYAAADLFLTKGGPNAILDSVTVGTPVLVDFCASPIERSTTKLFVHNKGCGLEIKTAKGIRAKIEEFATNPNTLDHYKEATMFFDKSKNGALTIADDIYKLSVDKFGLKINADSLV
ncbi:MAG: hypothetical protein IJ400_02215 [Clostridia bacterium]|nr:hypothetical protein [Clostridia bacterium]